MLGPDRGVYNGGVTVTATFPNVQGISGASVTTRITLDHFDEGQWHPVVTSNVSESTYATSGQIATVNDPAPGRWRVRLTNAQAGPARVAIDFRQDGAEAGADQAAFSASSMDFFDDLNKYVVDEDRKLQAVTVQQVIENPRSLRSLDSLVVVNEALPDYADAAGNPLGLTDEQRETYFANLEAYAEQGGNLVLTDGALKVLERFGVVPEGSVTSSQPSGRGAVPRVGFSLGGTRGDLCSPDTSDPLVKDVCLPGSAGGTARQVMEPVPLGYTPDTGVDSANDNKITQYHVNRAAWQADCGETCTSGLLSGQTALGLRPLGKGQIRIMGALLPDPHYNPSATRDMRFGVGSYSLAPAGWQMFLNLVDYQRPAPEADLSVTLSGGLGQGRDAGHLDGPARQRRARRRHRRAARADAAGGRRGRCRCPAAARAAGATVTCTVGDLAAGATRSVAITATPWEPGPQAATATVSGTEDDPDPSDNQASSSGSGRLHDDRHRRRGQALRHARGRRHLRAGRQRRHQGRRRQRHPGRRHRRRRSRRRQGHRHVPPRRAGRPRRQLREVAMRSRTPASAR